MTITVYSKPGCPACDATIRALNRYGLGYTVVDLGSDADALAHVMSLGYQQAPVVIVQTAGRGPAEHWSGFRLDLIRGLTAHQHTPNTKEAA